MTISYNLLIANSTPISMMKLLLTWKGSIYKAVWKQLIIWLSLYFALSAAYRFAFDDEQKKTFAKVVKYCNEKLEYIPINFMLGFFVTEIVRRWTTIFANIGFLDNVALMVATYVKGKSDEIRLLRRNIVRYCVLSQVLVFRDVNLQVRKRLPTLDTIVGARFMLPHEKARLESINNGFAKYWMPFTWAMELAREARRREAIDADVLLNAVIQEIKTFRTQMATICNYDWVPLPIMYPQLIFISVHTYFAVALISRQFLDDGKLDTYFPFMSAMQFALYMGWMKVSEALLNPMGEDDDDFECNWLLDRNLQIGLSIVDEGVGTCPEMIKDEFWGTDVQPLYAENSRPVHPLVGSTANINVVPAHTTEVNMVPLEDTPDPRYEAKGMPSRERRPSTVPNNMACNQRRVSVAVGQARNTSLTGSNRSGMLNNLKKKKNRSKPSLASLSAQDLSEKGVYVNNLNYYDSASPPQSPLKVNFDGGEKEDEKKQHTGSNGLHPDSFFNSPESKKKNSTNHEVVTDTITEEDVESQKSRKDSFPNVKF